ncbi:DUF4116 domain-containing protein [Endozoicomonas sp. ALE010]|uniref:DUF4116 domain-containing protein n=1 Tax=Endozoicomonas sp. ALE010 TaxID=3403081 RepID=UPI003BB71692
MDSALPTTRCFMPPIPAHKTDCHAAFKSAGSVIIASHDPTPCKRFIKDYSYETTPSCPLSTRDIELLVTDNRRPANHNLQPAILPPTTDRQTRAFMGGKGLFLHRMQQANIPVPPFTVVDTTLVAKLEQHPFPAKCLLPFLPDLHSWSHEPYSLEQLRTIVAELPHQQQAQCLKGLSGFIASEDFYQQVKNIGAAEDIRHLYLTLRQPSNEACIVRSSGVDEDRSGDAQAGRYDSRVHGGGDILKTCLQVLSSAYRPEVCPSGRVKPMALVLQQCIHCQLGGVVFSDLTLQEGEGTMQIEFAQGQPRGAVCGSSGIRPHRYTIRRGDDENSKPVRQFTPGDVTTQFVLEKISSEETGEAGYIERSTTVSTDGKDIMLTEEILQKLQEYTEQLADMFCCPVDIEFGVKDGQLHLFQCRPVTQLPGSTHFCAAPPSLPLAEGIMVSEGCCSGVALVVTEPVNAEQIPLGAILFAEHASDWMLAPDILKRLGGCVFKDGGTTDHVAITLRQAGIPCLVAGSQYSEALTQASGQQVTLVAGSFADSPGAYLQTGDQSAYWQTNSTTSGQDIISSPATGAAEPPDFTRVDEGFAWLNRQNNRLLDYFHPDRLISRCLGPGRSKAVSMSANRSKLLQQLGIEIQQLQGDLQQFVSGYKGFLALAAAPESNAKPSEVQPFTEELLLLEKQSNCLKDAIVNLRSKVVLPLLTTDQELPDQPVNFRQWLRDCQALLDKLQKLNQPKEVNDIHSAHDLIYWLHQRFVNALAPVAEASGQGQITKITDYRTLINILPQGVCGLLNDNCISVLHKLNVSKLRMLNMVDAAFINAALGVHVCTIAMLEQAEGGKGRTLRLDISDKFTQDKENKHLQGKLKRFWFLVQTLRCASIDSSSRPMAISFNQSAGKMTIEYTQVNTTSALQDGFVKLVTALRGLTSMDISINSFKCDKNTDKWYFETLVNKCQNGLSDAINNWTFKHCLVVDVFESREILSYYKDYAFVDYLDDEYRFFHEIAKEAYGILNAFRAPYRSSGLRQIFTDASELLKPDDAAKIIKELLAHMAIEAFFPKVSIQLLREDYNLDHDRDLVLFLVEQNPKLFSYISDEFRDDIEIAKSAIGQQWLLLKYASDRLKEDKSLVILAIKSDGRAIKYASTDIKNDKDFVLPLLSRDARIYKYLSDRLKSDPDIQAAARNKDTGFTQ